MYDLLLKNGEVIDPAQGIHGRRDVAIKEGRIAAVEECIPEDGASKVIPVDGKLVTPGLIDMHCHPSAGLVNIGRRIDETGIYSGVTTLCDAGSSGATNFQPFRRFLINPALTDTFCFINIAKIGLASIPEIRGDCDLDLDGTKRIIEENRDIIRGIKIRGIQSVVESVGVKAVELAKKMGTELGLPVMIHIGEARDRVSDDFLDSFTREAVKLLDRGDIISHFLTRLPGGLIQADGSIAQELWDARKRGVILDACHGLWHFSFEIAKQALNQGLLPTVISTDLSAPNVTVVQSLLVTMSKFLNLGLTIDQVVEMTTVKAAFAIGEENRGSLRLGGAADISILELVQGDFIFSDGRAGNRLRGKMLLEPRLVLKSGKEMPCCSRYHVPA
jgi:dihydroorotase